MPDGAGTGVANVVGSGGAAASPTQQGQCSRWWSVESSGDLAELDPSTLMYLMPSVVQISICGECDCSALSAWEIVGTSAFSSIAKHAIQICRRWRFVQFLMAVSIARMSATTRPGRDLFPHR